MKEVRDTGVLARIREIRTNKGYSQEYVAVKLGLKQSGYALIENGKNELSVVRLLQIAIILEENIINLIGYPFKYIKEIEVEKTINNLKNKLEKEEHFTDLLVKENNALKQQKIELENQLNSVLEQKKLLDANAGLSK